MKIFVNRPFFAELIGTYALSSIVLITLTPDTPFPVATPIAAAITLGLFVYLIGNTSGCHINPAISFAMFVSKQISATKLFEYIVAQFIGGYLAYLMISLYVPAGQETWLIPSHANEFTGVGEMLGAAFFAFGVFSTLYIKLEKSLIGVIVGASLLIGITISHNASFGVLNPAVAFATKAWNWDYLVMPFVGTTIGALISMALLKYNPTLESKNISARRS
ncbi:aquaporin [Vibrio sp. S4M6]|uniref:aquaporin n=1 Tax=Vibrio sinus TaxID=2946865 RepID=UPI002029DB59|nr:aquaporin [Vibrio sinus]MCL9779990.1 aquaporin [Vibrio sinus]